MSDCANCQRWNEINEDLVFRNRHISIYKESDTRYLIIPNDHMTATEMMANRTVMGYLGRAMLDLIERLALRRANVLVHWNNIDGNNHAEVSVRIKRNED